MAACEGQVPSPYIHMAYLEAILKSLFILEKDVRAPFSTKFIYIVDVMQEGIAGVLISIEAG
jgi:hypothetical protein